MKYWKFLRNCRHCVEHPQLHQKIAVENFGMTAEGKVEFPSIEVIHKETPEPRAPAANFMAATLKSVLNMGEYLMAFLAATNVQPGWQSVTVMEFPPGIPPEPACAILLCDEYQREYDPDWMTAFGNAVPALFVKLSPLNFSPLSRNCQAS